MDLSKAFDRVGHAYLFTLLDKVGFGQRFVGRLKLCYDSVATKIVVNGQCTDPIMLKSSVRQGCPLSPLLFGIYLEPLCQAVIKSQDIIGYRLCNSEVKVLAYADDIAFVTTDKRSVKAVLDRVSEFCTLSGAALNKEKSLGMWAGEWGTTPNVYEGITWQTVPGTYLGAPLAHSKNTNAMWCGVTAGLRQKSGTMKRDAFSIFQRAKICSVFLLARIVYLLHVMHCSRLHIQRVHRIFATYVWGSSFESMSRGNLFRAVADGGLGLPHIFVKKVIMRLIFYRSRVHPFLEHVKLSHALHHLPHITVATEFRHFSLNGFYKEVIECVKFCLARFSCEYVFCVPKRRLYWDLIDVLFPTPVYRMVPEEWPGKDVLKRISRMPIRPKLKTFFFKLHSGTLAVKTWLDHKGIFVPWNTNCRFCKVPETIDHLFIECTEAVFLWDDLGRALGVELRLNPHTIRFLPLADQNIRYDVLLVVAMFSLWKVRILDRHEEPLQPPLVFLRQELAEMKKVADYKQEVPDWLNMFCRKLLSSDILPL